jgi:hypothetical protein
MDVIHGEIVYQDIETGFWAIKDYENKIWQLLNIPEELKKEGTEVELHVKIVEQESAFMSGEALDIIDYAVVD